MKRLFLGALLLQGLNAQTDDLVGSPGVDPALLPEEDAPGIDIPSLDVTSSSATSSIPGVDFGGSTSLGVLGEETSTTDIGLDASDVPTSTPAPLLFGTADVILSTLDPSATISEDDGVRFGDISSPSGSATLSISSIPSGFGVPVATSTAGGRFGAGLLPEFPLGPGAGPVVPGVGGVGGLAASPTADSSIAVSFTTGLSVATSASIQLPGGRVPPQPSPFSGFRPGPALTPIPSKSIGKGKFGGLSMGGSSASPGSGKTGGKTVGKTGGISGLSVGDTPSGINGLNADEPSDPLDGLEGSDPEDGHRRPVGWDGEDNGIYDGEDFDPSGYYKKKFGGKKDGKKVKKGGKKGNKWLSDTDTDSDDEGCPRWCLESDDSDSSDDERPPLKKKKKFLRKKKVKTSTLELEPSDLDDEPSWGRDRLRRFASPQDPPSSGGLGGFDWPDKEDTPNDRPTKGKKGKGKGRCPKKCHRKGHGKGTTTPSGVGLPSPTTLVTSTTTANNDVPTRDTIPEPYLPPGPTVPGPENNPAPGPGPSDSESLGDLCPKTCNPFDPAANKCDPSAPCVTTGVGKYYCACRAGFRFDGVNPKDFALQFKVNGQPYVYGSEATVCNTLCGDNTCSEVSVRQQCA